MKFVRENKAVAVAAISKVIADALETDNRVLWLVSGGSNIAAEVAVMQSLHKSSGKKLEGLAILPMDERYGVSGHANSNVAQLKEAGFESGEATLIDVLVHDLSFNETVSFYADIADAVIQNAMCIVGQFGLGNDAHTAGILPKSPATQTTKLTVVGYKWEDYKRMTLTPSVLLSCNVAFLLAYGGDKESSLIRLEQNTEPLADLPAKLLYDVDEAYVYNDQLESEDL